MSDCHETDACLYALGLLDPVDHAEFESKLGTDPSLNALACNLGDSLTDILASQLASAPWSQLTPTEQLKRNVLDSVSSSLSGIASLLNLQTDESFIISDASGRIQWINAAFTAMSGYSLEELKGLRPGQVLRGEKTDPAVGERISAEIRLNRPCRADILNYRKDGTPYFVSLSITPILDGGQTPRAFVAIERELKDDPRLRLVS